MLDFFRHAIRLKKVKRQGWIEKLRIDGESVADHTYSMAVIGMAASDTLGLDFGRVQRMILLHDLAESVTGDRTPGSVPKGQKAQEEDRVLRRILGDMPEELSGPYISAWQEYTEQKTGEARLVRDIDRFEMAMQALDYAPGDRARVFVDDARRQIRSGLLLELLDRAERER